MSTVKPDKMDDLGVSKKPCIVSLKEIKRSLRDQTIPRTKPNLSNAQPNLDYTKPSLCTAATAIEQNGDPDPVRIVIIKDDIHDAKQDDVPKFEGDFHKHWKETKVAKKRKAYSRVGESSGSKFFWKTGKIVFS